MARLIDDPLLAVARAITTFMIVVFAVAALGCLAGLPIVAFYHDDISIEIAREGLHNPDGRAALAIAGMLVLAIGILACATKFLLNLRSIIDTVGAGDPFVAINAARLQAMGWLSLAVQALVVPVALLGYYVGLIMSDEHADMDFDVSAGGIFLTIILFILARVFRKGSEMRADLEGTV